MKKILFISIDPIIYRRRVINQMNSALEAGLQVHVLTVGPEIDSLPQIKIEYVNKPFNRGPLRFIHFNYHALRNLLKKPYNAVHVRGIWVLPAILLARIFKKFKVIYDAHEYFAGHELFQNHLWRRLTWLPIERLSVPLIDVLITVSEPLGNFYKERYPNLKEIKIIRSLPVLQETTDIAEQTKQTLQILFHGYFLPGRGLAQLLDALNLIREEAFELTIIGEGPLKGLLEEKISQYNLSQKVKLKPFVVSEKLLDTIRFADVGIALIEPDCINRNYALPNKFFEYIHAGLAVLASNIPTLKEYVERYKVGYSVDPYATDNIAQTIQSLIQNKSELFELKRNTRFAANELNWQNESKKLNKIYTQFNL